MIRTADMIAVQVCQPDLPDISLLEGTIEQGLLFLVWRRGIDDYNFLPADNVAVRVCRGRQRWCSHRDEHDTRPHFNLGDGLTVGPWTCFHSYFNPAQAFRKAAQRMQHRRSHESLPCHPLRYGRAGPNPLPKIMFVAGNARLFLLGAFCEKEAGIEAQRRKGRRYPAADVDQGPGVD